MRKALALTLSLIIIIAASACTAKPADTPVTDSPATEAPVTAGPTAVPATEPPSSAPIAPLNLREGDRSPIVITVQKRLLDLNYIDGDEPGEYFSAATTEAVKRFQRRNGLEATGVLRDRDYAVLMSSRALSYTPGPGDEGEDIAAYQGRLHELGYLNEVTGVFDEATEAAVILFQDKNFIPIDGMLGAQTVEYLYYDNVIPNSPDIGAHSDEILLYQQKLYELGYLLSEPEGVYSEDTVSAVKRFQGRNDLIVDGYLGPATAAVLLSGEADFNTLEYTMSGDDVMLLQERLAALNYLKEQEINGYFGTVTDNAVREFQAANDIEEDGLVDSHTREVLFSDSAVPADSSRPTEPGGTLRPTAVPASTPRPVNPITPGTPAYTRINNLISIASTKLGSPYIRGGKGPNSFDCSGFVYWCLNRAGVSVSYMTTYAWRTTNLFPRISNMSDIRAGDIIIFKSGDYTGHCGIAIGNGMMIDASSSNGMVVRRSYNTSYFTRTFYCAYRIFGN